MRKLVLLSSFFFIAPLLLAMTMFFSLSLSHYKTALALSDSLNSHAVAYAATLEILGASTEAVQEKDVRVETVRKFFARYRSPLEPYAEAIVITADLYDLDYRLVPAIAMQESNLCKKIPKDSYNCWGYGIYGNRLKQFGSYEEAIEAVTRTLAKDYRERWGLETPEEIMTLYTPQNTNNWAQNVTRFMEQLTNL